MNEVIAVAVGLGLVFGLLATELFGLAASGLIVPGYVALHFDRPRTLAATLAVAFVTMGVVRLASTLIVIHGRRRSAATLVVGYLFSLLAVAVPGLRGGEEIATVGLVVPGLVALWMDRQGVVETLGSVTVVSTLVRLALVVAGVELAP